MGRMRFLILIAASSTLLNCSSNSGSKDSQKKGSTSRTKDSIPKVDSIILKTDRNSNLRSQANSTLHKNSERGSFDIAINNKIILLSSTSIINSLGDLRNQGQDFPNEGEGVVIKNVNGTKYIKMIILPGSGFNDFRSFEVGYLDSTHMEITTSTPSNIVDFVTESGIKLGMSISEVKRIRDKTFNEKRGDSLTIIDYRYDDEGWLYTATYYFKKNRLIKFDFGYTNP